MIERYQTEEMNQIWDEKAKFEIWLHLEKLVLEAYESLNIIPPNISKELDNAIINVEQIKEEEKLVKHELLAFLNTISITENLRKHLHRGLTSSDILDTAFSLQLRQAGKQILASILYLLDALKEQAITHKYTIMMGRSHGMYAEPTTFGLLLLGFYSEFLRNKQRLYTAIDNISYLQFSGPVGNYSVVPLEVEQYVSTKLELKIEPVSTQVIPRDRYAEFFLTLGIIGSSLERLSIFIRNLHQSSVGEVSEGFSIGQKGSSAMPHKKNPIGSENITGIARLLRGYTIPALENIALWHERDMSHSSVERIISVDATSLCDYALQRMTKIIEKLEVNKDRMSSNMLEANGTFLTQAILTKLIDDGWERDTAYDYLQTASFKAHASNRHLEMFLENNKSTDLSIYIENISKIFDRIL